MDHPNGGKNNAGQIQNSTTNSRTNFRSHEEVQQLGKVRRERKQAEGTTTVNQTLKTFLFADRRLKVAEQERSAKEDITKSEDRRNRE